MKGKQTIRIALLLMSAVLILAACIPRHYRSGGDYAEAPTGALPPPEAAPFWEYITKTDPYRTWEFPPPKKGLFPSMRRGRTPANNPHGAYLMLFGNKAAMRAARDGHDKTMPYGAILIMEDYEKDQETLKSLSCMYRVRGYNPVDGDWFWVRYGPHGRVLDSGKAERCIQCHKSQDWHDWRFMGAMPHHH